MEEMMMMMNNESNTHHNKSLNIPTVTSPTCPTWKLYENPFYSSFQRPRRINHRSRQLPALPLSENQDQESADHRQKQVHRLHLPVPTRKLAASFWDLPFIKLPMESDLEKARAQIDELRAQLENERRSCKKMEASNKKLSRELSEERQCREALERVCEELASKISREKTEMERVRKEMEEERKMLRTAEVIREERVQMKLAEAKMLMEEKFSEIESGKTVSSSSSSISQKEEMTTKGTTTNDQEQHSNAAATPGNSHSLSMNVLRRASPEAENPHIKRGIKGFVEFPRVVRTIACRSSKHVGSKLECQKAQLKILLKQKNTIRFNNGLITS